MTNFQQLKRCEEQKREAAWNPAARWKTIQQTIAWAETQHTGRRNTPTRCKAEERRKLGAQKPDGSGPS